MLLQQVDHLEHHFFAFADLEQVDKVSKGLRIHGAGAAGDNQRCVVVPIASQRVNAAQIQHVEDIRIGKLVLKGESHHIEIGEGVEALETVEGNLVFPHEGFKVDPGSVDPLRPAVFPLINQRVKNFKPQVGHADFVVVGEAEGDPRFHLIFVLHDAVQLPADVAGRLLHLEKEGFQFFFQSHGKVLSMWFSINHVSSQAIIFHMMCR